MAATINSNILSLNAQRNLTTSQTSLATSVQRLSSGLRINSAKDDAAGLAISERFSTQIRGLNQAVRNANDGISLAQTAEGALASIGNNLQRIRELAVQSRNATNSQSDRDALQAEVAQLKQEIDRVADQTSFNGTKLLNGSFTSQVFQVGADQGQTIGIDSIADANIAALGNWTSVSTPAVAGSYTTGAISSFDFSTAGSALVGGTNTSVTLTATDFSGTNANFDVGGFNVSLTTDLTDADGVAAEIQSQLDTASTAGRFTVVASGNDLTITDTTSATAVAITNADAGAIAAGIADDAGTAGTAAVTGTNAGFSVDGNVVALTTNVSNLAGLVSEIQTQLDASASGAYVVAASGSGISITSATPGATPAVTVGTFTGNGSSVFGGGTAVAGAAEVVGTSQTGFATLNISTVEGADNAMLAMDAALTAVNSARADLGAIQNRFTSVVDNLSITAENLTASRSRIMDADFAAETAALSRAQILQQAGTAMVAQANQLPQGVLALLR